MVDTLVIGVGSPQGDDRAAWAALEQLARDPDARPGGTTIVFESLDRPGAALIKRWEGARRVILIDAVCSGAPAGTVHRIALGDLLCGKGAASTHGFGVAETIRLAQALDTLPKQLVILGIEAGVADAGGEALSPEVQQALAALVAAVRDELAAPPLLT